MERTARENGSNSEIHSKSNHTSAGKSSGRWLLLLLFVAVTATSFYFRDRWWPQLSTLWSAKPATTKPTVRIIPITTAPARRRDLEIYLNGLGTVTALKTVTIRSRVDGELINVAFTEGQLVQEGDLLFEIDSRYFEVQRDQENGQLARDEAILKLAQLNLTRIENLVQTKAVPQQELDNQLALVQQSEAQIKTDKAMVANAELQLSYCKIISPISGRIGLRLVDRGNIVRADDSNGLAVITQLRPIGIVFTISQDDIPRVQQRAQEGETLRVEAYDRGFNNKLVTGKLLATDNQVDPATGTLRLKAIVDEDETKLFPNQFVNTRLLVDVIQDAIVVPSSAVQRGPNSTFVYVVKADETVDLRTVVIGPSEGSETSIESGLEPGEIVATDGIDKLQPGAKVSTRDPNEKGRVSPGKPQESDRTRKTESDSDSPKAAG